VNRCASVTLRSYEMVMPTAYDWEQYCPTMKRILRPLLLVGVLAACSSSVTVVSLTPTAAAAPSSPTPSAAPSPIGFVLPSNCSYVHRALPPTPAPATPVSFWEFTCAGAATPDLMAVERIAPAFAQQGWTPCPSNPGTGVWWKGATETMVAQGSPYPGLSQLARQTQDCP
jgi:hypothetical protein